MNNRRFGESWRRVWGGRYVIMELNENDMTIWLIGVISIVQEAFYIFVHLGLQSGIREIQYPFSPGWQEENIIDSTVRIPKIVLVPRTHDRQPFERGSKTSLHNQPLIARLAARRQNLLPPMIAHAPLLPINRPLRFLLHLLLLLPQTPIHSLHPLQLHTPTNIPKRHHPLPHPLDPLERLPPPAPTPAFHDLQPGPRVPDGSAHRAPLHHPLPLRWVEDPDTARDARVRGVEVA